MRSPKKSKNAKLICSQVHDQVAPSTHPFSDPHSTSSHTHSLIHGSFSAMNANMTTTTTTTTTGLEWDNAERPECTNLLNMYQSVTGDQPSLSLAFVHLPL